LLVENNYFDSIGDVITYMSDEGTAIVNHSGNEIVNSGGTESRGTAFTPPYDYSLEPPSQARDRVMAEAGPR
jgi:pectate lyase